MRVLIIIWLLNIYLTGTCQLSITDKNVVKILRIIDSTSKNFKFFQILANGQGLYENNGSSTNFVDDKGFIRAFYSFDSVVTKASGYKFGNLVGTYKLKKNENWSRVFIFRDNDSLWGINLTQGEVEFSMKSPFLLNCDCKILYADTSVIYMQMPARWGENGSRIYLYDAKSKLEKSYFQLQGIAPSSPLRRREQYNCYIDKAGDNRFIIGLSQLQGNKFGRMTLGVKVAIIGEDPTNPWAGPVLFEKENSNIRRIAGSGDGTYSHFLVYPHSFISEDNQLVDPGSNLTSLISLNKDLMKFNVYHVPDNVENISSIGEYFIVNTNFYTYVTKDFITYVLYGKISFNSPFNNIYYFSSQNKFISFLNSNGRVYLYEILIEKLFN